MCREVARERRAAQAAAVANRQALQVLMRDGLGEGGAAGPAAAAEASAGESHVGQGGELGAGGGREQGGGPGRAPLGGDDSSVTP